MSRILITGKNGQLGKSIQKLVTNTEQTDDFIFVGREELDLRNESMIDCYFKDNSFDIIINCAAYTQVDKAEEEQKLANQVNHLAVSQLAQITKNQQAKLIHISTDYVFDGFSENPYTEDDKKNPTGVYGKTKLDGENKILDSGCKFCIIRTSWIFSEFGNNFLKTILNLASQNDEISVVSDQIGAPTYSDDISLVIATILPFIKNKNITNEIYHYSGKIFCSWYEFAKIIIKIAKEESMLKKTPILKSILALEYPTLAKRPLYSCLSSEKICAQFDIKPSDWKKGIKESLRSLKKQKDLEF